jgi:hypothetical protein
MLQTKLSSSFSDVPALGYNSSLLTNKKTVEAELFMKIQGEESHLVIRYSFKLKARIMTK